MKKRIIEIVTIIPIFCAGVAFSWTRLAIPDIDKRIKQSTDPIVEAINFQNFLIMATMPDSTIRIAEWRYSISKKGVAK
jgi:hypothetical protein